MNILLQLYACTPDRGGEFAVSWQLLKQLDARAKSNDCIYVVSLTLKREDICNLTHVKLIEVPDVQRWSFLAPLDYIIWQYLAYKTLAKKKIHIDIVQAYSLSDYRMPGFWYKLNCRSILGPIGGGQNCPDSIRDYDTKFGRARTYINKFFYHSYFFKKRCERYSEIYACNEETIKYFKKAKWMIDCPLNPRFSGLSIKDRNNTVPTVVFVGRLIAKKGVMLLLDVMKLISKEVEYQLLIYGDGPQKAKIQARIEELELEDKIKLMGYVPYDHVSDVYNNADIFVMPSLRESGGSVLVEAMGHGLPIVSFDTSLAHMFVSADVGLFVNVHQSKQMVLQEFADDLAGLIISPVERNRLGSNGYQYANKYLTWDKLIDTIYGSATY